MSSNRLKKLNRLLPLVAIGTVADCQSILEPTNRLITKTGIQILNQNQHGLSGLSELNKQLGIKDKMEIGYKVNSKDLGFTYSPILNSSGRLNHASLSISVLVGHDGIDLQNNITNAEGFDQALETSKLIATNQERKVYVKEITESLEATAKSQIEAGNKVLWLEGNWSKGVIGLFASRLVNLFNLPVAIVSKSGSSYTASLRAPDGFDFPKAFEMVKKYLTKGGGHPQAAGFSATEEQIINLRSVLPEAILKTNALFEQSQDNFLPQDWSISELTKEVKNYATKTDSLFLKSEQINQSLLQEIISLDPYSQDFPNPKIITEICLVDFKIFGSNLDHLKINLNGVTITCFYIDPSIKIQKGESIWCKLEVSQNSWNGRTNLELVGNVISNG